MLIGSLILLLLGEFFLTVCGGMSGDSLKIFDVFYQERMDGGITEQCMNYLKTSIKNGWIPVRRTGFHLVIYMLPRQ